MLERILSFLFCLLMVMGSLAQIRPEKMLLATVNPYVHDPVMAYEKGKYYLYCTGYGVMEYTSPDRRIWTLSPQPVINDFPTWIQDSVPGFKNQVWAPDIIYWHNKWWMAYACSTFGCNTSAIGLLTNSRLSNDHTWKDEGCIISTREGRDNANAIDPAIVIDEKDNPWLAYGSFWDGIQLIRLDRFMHVRANAQPHVIARRYPQKHAEGDTVSENAGKNAIEAPFIFKHDGYYYLFVSWGYCCRGLKSSYRVAVGRSKHIYGPYLDRNGRRMSQGGGTIIAQGDKKKFEAVGHCAVYHFVDGDIFICHGYSIPEGGEPVLLQRHVKWDRKGWPMLIL
jgi:arabinan endo-1,5-alpha-L-arabinosidase